MEKGIKSIQQENQEFFDKAKIALSQGEFNDFINQASSILNYLPMFYPPDRKSIGTLLVKIEDVTKLKHQSSLDLNLFFLDLKVDPNCEFGERMFFDSANSRISLEILDVENTQSKERTVSLTVESQK